MRGPPARARGRAEARPPRRAPPVRAAAPPTLIDPVVLLVGVGVVAGLLGALLGIGGGILIVPALAVGLGLPLRDAVEVSLVAIVATSGTAAAIYLGRGTSDLRLAIRLELFAVVGAIAGVAVALLVPERAVAGAFAVFILAVAATLLRDGLRGRGVDGRTGDAPGSAAASPGPSGSPAGRRLGRGIAGALAAGLLAGLFGIGGGIVLVPVMHLLMGIPLRVATATSALVVGVTATSAALAYLVRDGIDVVVAGPVVLGSVAGAWSGARIAPRVDTRLLRLLLVAILVVSALRLAERALG